MNAVLEVTDPYYFLEIHRGRRASVRRDFYISLLKLDSQNDGGRVQIQSNDYIQEPDPLRDYAQTIPLDNCIQNCPDPAIYKLINPASVKIKLSATYYNHNDCCLLFTRSSILKMPENMSSDKPYAIHARKITRKPC